MHLNILNTSAASFLVGELYFPAASCAVNHQSLNSNSGAHFTSEEKMYISTLLVHVPYTPELGELATGMREAMCFFFFWNTLHFCFNNIVFLILIYSICA